MKYPGAKSVNNREYNIDWDKVTRAPNDKSLYYQDQRLLVAIKYDPKTDMVLAMFAIVTDRNTYDAQEMYALTEDEVKLFNAKTSN